MSSYLLMSCAFYRYFLYACKCVVEGEKEREKFIEKENRQKDRETLMQSRRKHSCRAEGNKRL